MSETTHETDELLEAIEETNDLLVEAIEWANTSRGHDGGIRPSTAIAFDRMVEAHHTLAEVDPTRVMEEVEE